LFIFQRRKSAADEHIFYNLIVGKIFDGIDEIFISESVGGKESGEEFYEIIIIDVEKLENPVIENIIEFQNRRERTVFIHDPAQFAGDV
jgi:hypothetical protein